MVLKCSKWTCFRFLRILKALQPIFQTFCYKASAFKPKLWFWSVQNEPSSVSCGFYKLLRLFFKLFATKRVLLIKPKLWFWSFQNEPVSVSCGFYKVLSLFFNLLTTKRALLTQNFGFEAFRMNLFPVDFTSFWGYFSNFSIRSECF